MDSEYLTTKEVAQLLRIKERKVYDLASEQQIPCTRATGKLLFSRQAITQWLDHHSSGSEIATNTSQVLFAGSHDPLLEWAIRESQCGIPVMFDGSVDGLLKVVSGDASVSALHIYAPESKRWNLDAVMQHQDAGDIVLVRWVKRQRGLMMRRGLGLSSLKDIPNHKIVVRQAGAGSQLLLEHLLKESAIDPGDLKVALAARSEADVAIAIADGSADCGLGLESLALQNQLNFMPLLQESLDLLVDRRFWFEPQMQKFMAFCTSEAFSAKLRESVGYQAPDIWSVVYNS